jgi:hypothetical protein
MSCFDDIDETQARLPAALGAFTKEQIDGST